MGNGLTFSLEMINYNIYKIPEKKHFKFRGNDINSFSPLLL